MKRVINLDWLEIFVKEPMPLDVNYFISKGYDVKERAFGTPQYRQMFVIYENDLPFIEVRRDPYSLKKDGGIFEVGACHVRLSNRVLYQQNPINKLREFLCAHDYTYVSISRIDICCDFNKFDESEVQPFIKAYMSGTISKVNQSKLSAHGCDRWDGREFNSLKWGSSRSPNTTKLYNKSLELRENGEKKPYIREMWENAGLQMSKDVWRIEFSLTSQFQTMENKLSGEIVKKDLSDYDTPEKLMYQYFSLHAKYFDFRKVTYNRLGNLVRKYDCEKFVTLKYSSDDAPYICKRNPTDNPSPTRTLKMLANKLDAIREDPKEYDVYRDAADVMVSWFLWKHNLAYNQVKEERMLSLMRSMDDIRSIEEPDKFCLTLEPYQQSLAEQQRDYQQHLAKMERIRQDQEHKELTLLEALMRKYGVTRQHEQSLSEDIPTVDWDEHFWNVRNSDLPF